MSKKITAVIPIKMNSKRLQKKNIKLLYGKPLIHYIQETLLCSNRFDSINVYCSDEAITEYLLDGVTFIKRSKELDADTSNFSQIFSQFSSIYASDLYVYAHATSPYTTVDTINECLNAVIEGGYDSAFCAQKIQDYLWKDGNPLNFSPDNLPRSQDIEPIYRETSSIYVFSMDVFRNHNRRIGTNPYIKTVSFRESIDINTLEDFKLAELLYEQKELFS